MWLTKISIGNPVLATMMMMVLIVLGLFSYQRLNVDRFPDVKFPVVVVQTEYPGASPETIENDLTKKIEEAVNTINGINSLTSRSYQDRSIVIIEFSLLVDPAQAAQDVREKVALIKSSFRKEIKEPKITRYDPADQPILILAINNSEKSQKYSIKDLTTIADSIIKKRLENVKGVGSAYITGGIKREIQIYINPSEMEALGIGIEQVLNVVRNENQELPSGSIKTVLNEKIVQIRGKIKSPNDFENIVVAKRGGYSILLGQIANVVDSEEEQQNLALFNGQRTLALNILKAQNENTIEVSKNLKKAIKELKPNLDALYPGIKLTLIVDESRKIEVGVKNVRQTVIEGAVLTILIVFLFLNSWRSTVITGLTLPVSLIGTFLFMDLFGFTINTITLMALSICVGLLIDDAIVVRENIVRHSGLKKNGNFKTPFESSLDGTKEIGLAVLATTSSIVAVFLPVGFMGGIIGRFFHQFGITVAVAVLISMFVSFTLDPMLSSIWAEPKNKNKQSFSEVLFDKTIGWVLKKFEIFTFFLSKIYQISLKWSLKNQILTLVIALFSFFGGLLMPFYGIIGTEFVPKADYSETGIEFYTPPGSSLEFTEKKAKQVEKIVMSFPEVLDLTTLINTGATKGKNYATIYIRLIPKSDRKISSLELNKPIRDKIEKIPGLTVTHVGSLDGVGGDKKQVRLFILGSDLKILAKFADEALKKIKSINGIVDIDTSLKNQKPAVWIEPNREIAADLGISVSQIGNAVRPLLAGESAGIWQAPDNSTHNIMVRLPPSDRNNISDLSRIMLPTNQIDSSGLSIMVPLSKVANIKEALGANSIKRRDLNREVEISANVVNRPVGDINKEIKSILEKIKWQPGYKYKIGGSSKSMNESFGYALKALLMAIIFIYMILASQFASFLQPIAIMSALPLTLIGVFISLLIFKSTLNLFSIIGFIMLMGLVTKNAILLVDFTNKSRKLGMTCENALLEAAKVRFRPILMTTLAMIFGMLPLALGITEGSEQRAPMGQAVIGGIITSSVLTLVVVPVIYVWLENLKNWCVSVFRSES